MAAGKNQQALSDSAVCSVTACPHCLAGTAGTMLAIAEETFKTPLAGQPHLNNHSIALQHRYSDAPNQANHSAARSGRQQYKQSCESTACKQPVLSTHWWHLNSTAWHIVQ